MISPDCLPFLGQATILIPATGRRMGISLVIYRANCNILQNAIPYLNRRTPTDISGPEWAARKETPVVPIHPTGTG